MQALGRGLLGANVWASSHWRADWMNCGKACGDVPTVMRARRKALSSSGLGVSPSAVIVGRSKVSDRYTLFRR
jgi:hypothetical protein